MNNRGLQARWFLGVLLCTWIALPGWGIGPPPIYNMAEGTNCYSSIPYAGLDDLKPPEVACGICSTHWPESILTWCRGDIGPSTDCSVDCEAYDAFALWFYQDCLIDTDCTSCDIQDAPLYLDSYDGYSGDPLIPDNVRATLEPFEGLDALRYVPVEVVKTARPPIASARYKIKIDWTPSEDPDIRVGALFWLTAIYDESVFDVRFSVWTYNYWDCGDGTRDPSQYRNNYILPSGTPVMFAHELYGIGNLDLRTKLLRLPVMALVPEYVTIRLKDGFRLEDLGGRKVELKLHTLSWAGECDCRTPASDAFRYRCTHHVQVGADLGEQTDDWAIRPAQLADECVPPAFAKVDDKSAEADVIGTRTVKDINTALPLMHVGANRFKVARTLACTRGNDAIGHFFGELAPGYGTGGFVSVNIFGVWFATDDVPGWQYHVHGPLSDGNYYIEVFDGDSSMFYTYRIDTSLSYTGYDNGKLLGAFVGNDITHDIQMVRWYDYAGDNVSNPLVDQMDPAGNRVDYSYNTTTGQLTVTGTEVADGEEPAETRMISATFAPSVCPDVPGTGTLISCTGSSGDTVREYEWYQPGDTPKAYDGKLKKVKDANGNVLAGFVYDNRSRLTQRYRGSTSQPVADYIYHDTPPGRGQPPGDFTMDARFYVDDDGSSNQYQLVRRTFNPQGQVIQVDEYQDLQTVDEASGGVSTTTFDYCEPPDDLTPENTSPDTFFYQRFCGVWLGRCVIKTLPPNGAKDAAGNDALIAEYTQYEGMVGDYSIGWNVVQTFLAPPPAIVGGQKVEPPGSLRHNWLCFDGYVRKGGAWLKGAQIDRNRKDSQLAPDGATTSYVYDNWSGCLVGQWDPPSGGLSSESMVQTWTYLRLNTSGPQLYDFRKVSLHIRGFPDTSHPGEATIVTATGYEYEGDNVHTMTIGDYTQLPPSYATWTYQYNDFGQKTLETDPDGYTHQTDYNSNGQVEATYTFAVAGATSGYVVQQTTYEYQNGMIWKIHVADNPGSFALNSPEDWIDTVYGYDAYGRLTSKQVSARSQPQTIYTTQYQYDRQDRLVKVVWPDGRWKKITRDGRGQIQQVDYHGTGNELLTNTYGYDDAGNLVTRNTQGCPQCGRQTCYTYDVYNRRLTETRKGS